MKLTAQIIITLLVLTFIIAPWFANDLFWKFCSGSFIVICILLALMVKRNERS